MLFPILIAALPFIGAGWFIPQRMNRYHTLLAVLVLMLGGLALLVWTMALHTRGYESLPWLLVTVAVGYGTIAGATIQLLVLFQRKGGSARPEEQGIRWMGGALTLLVGAAFVGRT